VSDRMFHVLVLGGMALVGCGGATGTVTDAGVGEPAPSDAASAEDSFPSETNAGPLDAYVSTDAGAPQSADSGHVGFPSELPPPPPDPVDGGVGDAGAYADAMLPDAGPCVPCELLK
jgi:hypothetical protein